ncbi:DUF4838 domain-containing protein, partial [Candidatus Latescibacterota bacterium]
MACGKDIEIFEDMPIPKDKVPIMIGSYQSVPGDTISQEKYSIRIAQGSKTPVISISGGRPRGTLYGVYVFLKRLGFRWYTPSVTKFPEGDTFKLQYMNEEGSPAFMMRYPGVHVQRLYDPTWAARNLINATISPGDKKRGGRVNVYGVHTFDRLIPRSLYKDHPEYFPFIGGKRITGYVQRCLTNPGVVEVAAKNIMDSMEKNKESRIFSLSQGDVDKYCECPDCMKIMEEEGAPSGLYVRFVNQVAEIVEEKYPDNYISTLAYWFTQKPPKTVKPRHNVIIRLCPISIDVARPFYESKDYRSREFAQDLKGWSKITDRIFLWLYNTDFCHMLMPFPSFKGNIEAIKTYAKHGVKGVYIEGNAYPELSIWVFARLLWNPDLDPDELINEWMHAVYGKAYEPMRKAFDLMHKQVEPHDRYLHVFDAPTRKLWPEHVVSSMDKLHEEAEKLAASDSTALYYVKKNRIRVDYLNYILNTGRLTVKGNVYAPTGNTVSVKDFDQLYEKALSFGVTRFGSGWADHKSETLLRQRVESHPLVTLENENIRL